MNKSISQETNSIRELDIVYSYRFIQEAYRFIDSQELLIVILLSSYNPTCFASQETIAKKTGLSASTVMRRISSLCKSGIISIEKNIEKNSNVYTVNRCKIKELLDKYDTPAPSERPCQFSQPDQTVPSQRLTKVQLQSTTSKVLICKKKIYESSGKKNGYVNALEYYHDIVEVVKGRKKVVELSPEDLSWWDQYIRTTLNYNNMATIEKKLTARLFEEGIVKKKFDNG